MTRLASKRFIDDFFKDQVDVNEHLLLTIDTNNIRISSRNNREKVPLEILILLGVVLHRLRQSP
jgi:hypothetical protein